MKVLFMIVLLAPFALAGYGPDQCDYYNKNADWLPPNYQKACMCICTKESLNSPAENCVREKLQQLHAQIPIALKNEARTNLHDYLMGQIDGDLYRAWTDSVFGDLAHDIHVKAFEECGCDGTPAGQWSWDSIFLWDGIVYCSALRIAQGWFSYC